MLHLRLLRNEDWVIGSGFQNDVEYGFAGDDDFLKKVASAEVVKARSNMPDESKIVICKVNRLSI